MKAGWKTVKLGEIAEIYNGNTVSDENKKRLIALPNTGLAFIATKDVGFDGVINYDNGINIPRVEAGDFKVARKDAVLVCAEGGSAGRKIGHIDRDVHFGNKLFALNASSAVLPRYLYHYCLSEDFRKKFKGLMAGLIGGVSVAKFKQIEIPLPPLAEQKRIVALLDEAFAGIDEAKAKAEANIRDAEILFESYLQSVFHDQEQGWEQKRLGDLVTRLTNGYVGPTRNIYQESGVPYLLARHVKNNRLNFDGRTFISQEFNIKNKKSLLKTGDVLLVQSGHIGHCAVVTDEHDGHNCHAMIVITATKGSFIGPFLSLFFNSSGMKRKFEQIRSGSTVPHLTCGEIRELMIPLPTIEIQKDIVERAKVLDEYILQLRANLANRLSAYDEFKRSLLIQAFAGELTA